MSTEKEGCLKGTNADEDLPPSDDPSWTTSASWSQVPNDAKTSRGKGTARARYRRDL
jgi:hypothetical protein